MGINPERGSKIKKGKVTSKKTLSGKERNDGEPKWLDSSSEVG